MRVLSLVLGTFLSSLLRLLQSCGIHPDSSDGNFVTVCGVILSPTYQQLSASVVASQHTFEPRCSHRGFYPSFFPTRKRSSTRFSQRGSYHNFYFFFLFFAFSLSQAFCFLFSPSHGFSLKILGRKSKNRSLRVKNLFILERVLERISLVFLLHLLAEYCTLSLSIILNSKLKQLLSPMFHPSPQSFSSTNPTVVIHLGETFYFLRHLSLSCILQAT